MVNKRIYLIPRPAGRFLDILSMPGIETSCSALLSLSNEERRGGVRTTAASIRSVAMYKRRISYGCKRSDS